eukprot:TRINITY_DN1765_c0_g1_i1.p1 TRINITY_DN1765_c0_g1~~TRINITY_DN1765_c0_g1_i1.p1  ORF type:complete len:344 (-),score=61.26 TRINITY_DN1765_c0_g1_i1:54-1085(-)
MCIRDRKQVSQKQAPQDQPVAKKRKSTGTQQGGNKGRKLRALLDLAVTTAKTGAVPSEAQKRHKKAPAVAPAQAESDDLEVVYANVTKVSSDSQSLVVRFDEGTLGLVVGPRGELDDKEANQSMLVQVVKSENARAAGITAGMVVAQLNGTVCMGMTFDATVKLLYKITRPLTVMLLPYRMKRGNPETECSVCFDGGDLLICDGCDQNYHLHCARPPLAEVPPEEWFCQNCSGEAVCSMCTQGGELLICDGCNLNFHMECVGLSEIPDGDQWFCDPCSDKCTTCNGCDMDFVPESTGGNGLFCASCNQRRTQALARRKKTKVVPQGQSHTTPKGTKVSVKFKQ